MKDIILDIDGDLDLSGGDLIIGDSTKQNQKLLIVLPKGAMKENPDATVSALNYLEGEDASGLLREVRTKFAADGMTVNKVGYDNAGNLITDAFYPE